MTEVQEVKEVTIRKVEMVRERKRKQQKKHNAKTTQPHNQTTKEHVPGGAGVGWVTDTGKASALLLLLLGSRMLASNTILFMVRA